MGYGKLITIGIIIQVNSCLTHPTAATGLSRLKAFPLELIQDQLYFK